MLKKYLQFIKEDISAIEDKHHSLGEWVEDLCENKEVLELIKPYLDDTNPSVKISNSINVLDSVGKNSIYKIVTDYLNGTGRKTDIRTFVDLTNEAVDSELQAGKNVFTSFLKIITSLGMKDVKPTWDNIPDDFLLFFEYKAEYYSLCERIERFPSMSMFKEKLPKANPKLYFGIKNDMKFNFGFMDNNNAVIPIGEFNMNKAAIKYLQLVESPSAAHLKRELAYLNPDNLKIIAAISRHMKLYHPGNTEKRSFKINDGTMEFGYHGLGSWTNGKISDIDSVKEGFKDHLRKFKGHDKLQMAIRIGDSMWLYCIIKIK